MSLQDKLDDVRVTEFYDRVKGEKSVTFTIQADANWESPLKIFEDMKKERDILEAKLEIALKALKRYVQTMIGATAAHALMEIKKLDEK